MFISNRNNGLLDSVSKHFPLSPHSFCLHHLKMHLNSRYPVKFGNILCDRIVKLFMKCAYAPMKAEFQMNMKCLMNEGGLVAWIFGQFALRKLFQCIF